LRRSSRLRVYLQHPTLRRSLTHKRIGRNHQGSASIEVTGKDNGWLRYASGFRGKKKVTGNGSTNRSKKRSGNSPNRKKNTGEKDRLQRRRALTKRGKRGSSAAGLKKGSSFPKNWSIKEE